MSNYVYLVPLFPLIGFLINGLFRKSVSKSLAGFIGSAMILASFIVSAGIFFQVKQEDFQPVTVTLFQFIHAGNLKIPFSFLVDPLSTLFLLIITGVGFLIHLYSTAYMKEENAPDYAKYFCYLNLFVFFMLLLVLGSNFVILFIGWEGVGLCSYLLIGYWFKNIDYDNAAKKAFIMNRIGDVGFLIAIFAIINKFGSVSFDTVFQQAPTASTGFITAVTLLLFIGATGKSVQIPLYTWLPDAMAGPTPVSALIHAATMVTAGIYMIARSHVLYNLAPVSQTVVAITGLATIILAALIAVKQNDIKKVLAYSTVSQLGYMFLGLGVGAYTEAVFHVLTHAFFKALLFLCAGSVIHAMSGEQDIRGMGGLKKFLPITHITFLMGCLAISGIPPFSGFFSKDEILTAAYGKNPVYYIVGVAGAMITAFYMFRLYATAFLGKFRGTDKQQHHLHESPPAITIPLMILGILAVVGGFLGIPEIFAKNSNFLAHFLGPVLGGGEGTAEEIPASIEWMLMGVSTVLAIAMVLYALSRFSKKPELGEPVGFAKWMADKFCVDEIYDALIVKPLNALADFFNQVIERKLIDGLVNGTGRLVQYGSRQLRYLQSGQVGGYVLLMVIGTVLLFVVQLFLRK
ncbi:MAG TPA: NADH-quinone oxidoreductase subunit L [Puia sp.]